MYIIFYAVEIVQDNTHRHFQTYLDIYNNFKKVSQDGITSFKVIPTLNTGIFQK